MEKNLKINLKAKIEADLKLLMAEVNDTDDKDTIDSALTLLERVKFWD